MFNSNMDTFWDDSLSDLLVDNNSNSSRVDVEDTTCTTMVVFVWHTLVNGSIDANVNNISDLIGCKSLGNMDGSVLFESFSEFVSSSSVVSVAVGHRYG
jgi:hypothetical protein